MLNLAAFMAGAGKWLTGIAPQAWRSLALAAVVAGALLYVQHLRGALTDAAARSVHLTQELTQAHADLKIAQGQLATLSTAAVREARAAEIYGRRLAGVDSIFQTLTDAIAHAPPTSFCLARPAVRAGLDSVREQRRAFDAATPAMPRANAAGVATAAPAPRP